LIFVALVAAVGVGSASAAPRPSKPRVLGPRQTTDRTPTFRFVSSEHGLSNRALRFRCALDAGRLRPCPRRYTPTLGLGRHRLRVVAVDPRGRTSPTTTAVVRVLKRTPGPARPDQTIRVAGAPYNVIYGFGSLWAAVDRTLVRLDPTTGAVQARIEVGGRPWGLVIGDGAVWVGNLFSTTVVAVDPGTNAVSRRIVLDGSPVGVAVGGGAGWATSYTDDRVWRFDLATGEILSVTHVGDTHEFVGYSEGRVWVASENGTVAQLDAATGAVTKTIATGLDADYLGFSPGSVWVSNYASSFLWRLDASTGAIAQRISIGYGAQGVVDDGTALWVAMYNSGFVLKVDRASGKILERFRVGDKPRGVTIALGSVWVANSASNTISRIGLNR
jgi:YVTN family beta-propeller protein